MRQVLCVAAGVIALGAAFGQVPAPAGFDAASVKPSARDDLRGSTYNFNPGGVEVINGTLRAIVQMAYDVQSFQVAGGPGWMDSERYDISAKIASEDAAALGGDRQARVKDTRARLQALLADRFRLQVHRETREIPEYALILGKEGAKLAAATDPASKGGGIRGTCGQITGTRASMANLVYALSRQLRRPVMDRTALAGVYDFQLEFAPDAGGCGAPAGVADAEVAAKAAEAPSIFTALQERLGLKLEGIKGPAEIVVIDRAERPAPN